MFTNSWSLSRSPVRGAGLGLGVFAPVFVALPLLVGCGGDDEVQRTLDPVQLGMTDDMDPIYDDGETQLFEVRTKFALPILRPNDLEMADLRKGDAGAPYGRALWVNGSNVHVKISWTLTNLDRDDHAVELLIDPWNEFGRYWPGMQVADAEDEELSPNLSGIDHLYLVPGSRSGERLHGTYTEEDAHEMARDFATAMRIIDEVPPPPPDDPAAQDPAVLVNHAFDYHNRSTNDPLVAPYLPEFVAGLTGIDIGLRSRAPMNVAVEVVVEIRDQEGDRVWDGKESKELLPEPTEIITVGYGL